MNHPDDESGQQQRQPVKSVPGPTAGAHEQTRHTGRYFVKDECPRHLWRAVRFWPAKHQHALGLDRQPELAGLLGQGDGDSALAWARAALAEMGRAHPAAAATLREALARPVLYFDHEHQLVLDGEVVEGWVRYRAVALPPSASPQLAPLAAAIGAGDRLTLDDRQLLVERGGHTQLRLERTDPALGLIAPFGVVP